MTVGDDQMLQLLVGKAVFLLVQVGVRAEVDAGPLADHIGGAAAYVLASATARLLASRTGAKKRGPTLGCGRTTEKNVHHKSFRFHGYSGCGGSFPSGSCDGSAACDNKVGQTGSFPFLGRLYRNSGPNQQVLRLRSVDGVAEAPAADRFIAAAVTALR